MTEGGSGLSLEENVTALSVWIEAILTIIGETNSDDVIGQLSYNPVGPGPCPAPLPSDGCWPELSGTVSRGDVKQILQVLKEVCDNAIKQVGDMRQILTGHRADS